MKAIVSLTDEEFDQQNAVLEHLRKVLKNEPRSAFIDCNKAYGYAHYSFSGHIKPELVKRLGRQPTEDEIIMLVDGGFSHFGASCTINGDFFRGLVNID